MSNSYRIRTNVGVDKSIRIKLEQDFESLEILSLKVLQDDVYIRKCSDYGVIVGRVSVNNGYGIPNAKVSIFIPLSDEDVNNPVISELYPYKNLSQINTDGYRYNLLPTEPSHSNHVPTGSFFTRNDVLTNPSVIEVYDKYYKYTAVTNESGDYMILGVPLGSQNIVVNIDLSDIGEFSLSPQDLIRMGVASPQQVNGTKFNSSNNFSTLPQIITINRTVNIEPFWGDDTLCDIGITRTDFDITSENNITIRPTSIFMGSIISSNDDQSLKLKCKPNLKAGQLCSLITGPGQIQAIRQTTKLDIKGRPALEVAEFEDGGQVIDEDGTWMFDVPMNLDYVVTNEFGEQVISKDPSKGIPTKGKYRFKIMWNQPNDLGGSVKRANFLVPNIKEYGWINSDGIDPLTGKKVAVRGGFGNLDNPCDYNSTVPTTLNGKSAKSSYAFSLDWDDYGDDTTPIGQQMILEAINCEDRFFEMKYNKVYTVSQLISEYRKGSFNNRIISVKNILDDTCESTNNKFPSNDGMYRLDIIFILFQILMAIAHALLFLVVFIYHLFMWVLCKIIKPIISVLADFWCFLKNVGLKRFDWYPFRKWAGPKCTEMRDRVRELNDKCQKGSLTLPNLTYPDCELCSCDAPEPSTVPADANDSLLVPNSVNADILSEGEYGGPFNASSEYPGNFSVFKSPNTQSISGVEVSNNGNSNAKGVLYDTVGDDNSNYFSYTTDLPWHERFNLFNTKAKYFDNNANNPGGGVNRIGVRFNTLMNGGDLGNSATLPINNVHLDNVIVVLMDEGSESEFPVKSMFTTVNPELSSDINLKNVYPINEFGTNSITGRTVGTLFGPGVNKTTITLNYANPNGNGSNLTTNYDITGSSDPSYHKFPIDVEYFQVIHNVSLLDYINDVEVNIGNPNLPNSLYSRVINAGFSMSSYELDSAFGYYYLKSIGVNASGASGLAPIRNYYINSHKLRVVVMVRGVDPNSPKTRVSYDLSRLYGQNSYGKKVITLDDVRMNIPVQGGFRNVKHNLTNNTNVDSYSNVNLFYDTFMWKPSINTPATPVAIDPSTVQYDINGDEIPGSGSPYSPATLDPDYRPAGFCDFTAFTTNNHIYYSSLDENIGNSVTNIGSSISSHIPFANGGLRVYGNNVINGIGNASTTYFNPDSNLLYYPTYNDNASDSGNVSQNIFTRKNRGYFLNESVEGGALMATFLNQYTSLPLGFGVSITYPPTSPLRVIRYSVYFSYIYSNLSMNIDLGTSGRQIVMRSDRLPSSSFQERNNGSFSGMSYVLMANNNFSYYIIADDGSVTSTEGTNSVSGVGSSSDSQLNNAESSCNGDVLNTFSCEGLIPLECYYYNQSTGRIDFVRKPQGPLSVQSCWGNQVSRTGYSSTFGSQSESIMDGGCYKLGTVPFNSLRRDFKLLGEWRARLVITFGACRNVFSHYFTNNWINGTLYAFSFKNSRRFTSPTETDPNMRNKPYNCYCKNNIFFNQDTNNFYYRSSPYSLTKGFVGRKNPVSWLTGKSFGGNNKNLMFPTTIMDLGPRDVYTQEIVYSNDYDGYVMKNLQSTSYKDVSELLNLFIISRFINKKSLVRLTSFGIQSIRHFFSRNNLKIDGDYAQMNAINSELGVLEFNDENYDSCTDVYYNGGDATDGIFGVFYDTDNQTRDYLSPKRTIITEDNSINITQCSFEYFNVKTQEVPFYQWEIKENTEFDSIFGSQTNDWFTDSYSGSSHFKYGYQNLDRLLRSSRYFRTNGNMLTKYYRGNIYSVDNQTPPVQSGSVLFWDKNNAPDNSKPNVERVINTGAPYYFYFGLHQGKSAFDRFTRKWIDTDIYTD